MPTAVERSGAAWASRARALPLLAAALLAAILLYYSLRGIDWRQVARLVAGASALRLALAAAISTLTLALRACRWRVLLNAEGQVGLSTAFWATAAGYFGNNFLPARAGEFIRTYMVATQSRLQLTFVLATAVSERVADTVLLLTIGAMVVFMLPEQAGWLAGAARPIAVIALGGALGIVVLPLVGSTLMRAIARAPLPGTLRPRLVSGVEHALRGMRTFHDAARVSAFFGLSLVIWSLDACATIVGASALGLHLSLAAAFLLLAGLGLGSALPSTPGYVGIYQFVAVTVLGPFGFSRTSAIAFILVAQAVSYVVIGFWGLVGILQYRRTRTI